MIFRKWREARLQRAQARKRRQARMDELRMSHPWLFGDRWSPEEQRILESREAPPVDWNIIPGQNIRGKLLGERPDPDAPIVVDDPEEWESDVS